MANQLIPRREALQRLAILLGGTLSLPLQTALAGERLNLIPINIPSDQQALIADMADVILPQTTTPGAKEAGVGPFIVRVLEDCTSNQERDNFLHGLEKTNSLSQSSFGKTFRELSSAQQNEIMGKVAKQENSFFQSLRELTIVGFFTSQLGATQVLEYMAVPGRFQGDIPMKNDQRTWAT